MDALNAYSTMLALEALGVEPDRIARNCERVKARFEPDPAPKPEPCAVLGYGPSLRETWAQLRTFKVYITTSGAHNFIAERGLTPTWHVESDPREHKTAMLTPRAGVRYLAASIVHPSYLAKLSGSDVRLFHILLSDPAWHAKTPAGEWIVTGGTTVGPRAVKIARLLGYNDIHLFGFDGCGQHAAAHTNPLPNDRFFPVRLNGKSFLTTEGLLMHTRGMFDEFATLWPDVTLTFHGEGLAQEMAKAWKHERMPGFPMAVQRGADGD